MAETEFNQSSEAEAADVGSIHHTQGSGGRHHKENRRLQSDSRQLHMRSNSTNHHPETHEDRQITGNHHTAEPEVRQDTEENLHTPNSFNGFIDILYRNEFEMFPWSCVKVNIHKVGLLVYFFTNFVYSIVAAAVQGDNLSFYLVYIFMSLLGFIFELFSIMMLQCKERILSNDSEDETGSSLLINQQDIQADYRHKTKRVAAIYVLFLLGEVWIYPILICTLYGLINERAWRFDNGISGCNFLFFIYSVMMDAVYLKFYLVHFVIRISHALYEYARHNELWPTELTWRRFITPIYFAIVTALTHWLMIGIVGVRVYVDNFTPKKYDDTDDNFIDEDDTNSSIPNTGDYRVVPFTWYILACTIYLPIASWATFIRLNKLWLTEIFSAINTLNTGNHSVPTQYTLYKKLFAFICDPLAYIAIVLLMSPFVVFTVGAFLLDYDSSYYEVASSARISIQVLAVCFIIFFVFSNLQATIIPISVIVGLVVTLPGALGVLLYILKLCGQI